MFKFDLNSPDHQRELDELLWQAGDWHTGVYLDSEFDEVDRYADRIVAKKRDFLLAGFNLAICDEKKLVALQDHDYRFGLIYLIQRWMEVHRRFPLSAQPAVNSIGFETALDGVRLYLGYDQSSGPDAQAWLRSYYSDFGIMRERVDAIYLDGIKASSTTADHALLLDIQSQLPPHLEEQRPWIEKRFAEV